MKRLLFTFMAFSSLQTTISAQIFKKKTPDEIISKTTNQFFRNSEITVSRWQQNSSFDGFNAIFSQNTIEYPTFEDKIVGFEMTALGWKPNKKFKIESTLASGFVPKKTVAQSSVAKWNISGSVIQAGLGGRYVLFQKKGFSFEPYAGMNYGFISYNLAENFPQKTTNNSLQNILINPPKSIDNFITAAFINGVIGVATRYQIPFKTLTGTEYSLERGLPITFKIGYSANLARSKWASNEANLDPQPSSKLSGLHFTLGIGFYRKINKL